MPDEFRGIQRDAYISCDSSLVSSSLEQEIPGGWVLPRAERCQDIDGRGQHAIIDAAVDLRILSRAGLLYVHAPPFSTFSDWLVYGLGMPTCHFQWRSDRADR